jgi:dienelactone hydrolase
VTLKRVLAAAAAAVLLLAGAYAGYLRHRARQTVSLVATGAYPVGRAVHELADRSRTDELNPLGGIPRVLSVWLWYPAAAPTGPASAYVPGSWGPLHRFGWAQTDFDRVRPGTYDDAPIATGTFPIVVLLPGLGLSAPQYTALATRLAARGYLVAGVTPTYSADIAVLGGRPVRSSAAGHPPDLDGPRAARLLAVWAADARFTANRVGALLGRHADPARITYVGHAFGGAASIEACRTDTSCAGAASLDGIPSGPAVELGLQHPLLLLSAGREGAAGDPATQRLFAGSGPAAWAYTFAGAGHLSFTDYAEYWLAAPVRATLPLGRARTIPVAGDYLAAFLETAVRGTAWRAPRAAGVQPTEMLNR